MITLQPAHIDIAQQRVRFPDDCYGPDRGHGYRTVRVVDMNRPGPKRLAVGVLDGIVLRSDSHGGRPWTDPHFVLTING